MATLIINHNPKPILVTESTSEPNPYKSAVAIVYYRNKWLLGLSTSDDFRKNKWCFPGGGINNGESFEDAAVREAFEEMNVHCSAVNNVVTRRDLPHVAFVPCRAKRMTGIDTSNEFSHVGWFTREQMRGLVLLDNVKSLMNSVRR